MITREEHIIEYLRNVERANNETAKKELLKNLLVRLFDKDPKAQRIIDTMSLCAEHVVFQIPLRERIKTGFVDTQYGNVIIDFEKDLNKTREHAKEQLCEYLAGNWQSGHNYSYMLIATDCVHWVIYAPRNEPLVNNPTLRAEDIELVDVEQFTLTTSNAEDFWQVEEFWEANKTDRSKNMSYLDRIDYQSGITDQTLNQPYLVVYTSSAKDANATVVETDSLDLPFIVDHMAYWFATNQADEAYYLTSFLNSGVPNLIIKDFQSRGLFGP